MSNLIKIKKLHGNKSASRPKTVTRTVVRNSRGQFMDIYTLDARSPTFDDDLTFIYRTNVADARRENLRLFGSADGRNRRRKRSGPANAAKKK